MTEREEETYRPLRGPHIIDFLEQIDGDLEKSPRMLGWLLRDVTRDLREFPKVRGFFERLHADIEMAPRMLGGLFRDIFTNTHEIPRVIADGVLYRTGYDLYKDKDKIVALGKAWGNATKAYCARELSNLQAQYWQQSVRFGHAASDLVQNAKRQGEEFAHRMEPGVPTAMPVQSEASPQMKPAA